MEGMPLPEHGSGSNIPSSIDPSTEYTKRKDEFVGKPTCNSRSTPYMAPMSPIYTSLVQIRAKTITDLKDQTRAVFVGG
jgi:hypothetical protein